VPRQPQHPGQGGTIGLALDRRPASGARLGILLVNPGGPGASGVDFLPQVVSLMPRSLLDRFDVIGFDPPGVDRSAPITCLDTAGLQAYFDYDPAPTTAAGLAGYNAVDRAFAAGCQNRSGAELPYVSTVDAAMDMDYIRAASGDAQLSYLGFSYGTFLGATYAGLYPGRVRAMVLDGALNPALSPLDSAEQQAVSFEHDLHDALAACVAHQSCPWKPTGDPVAAYQDLMAQVRAHPLPVKGTSRTAGPSALLYGTAYTLYDTAGWPSLYQMLADASHGDGTAALELSDAYDGVQQNGSYSNEFEAFAAVTCLDAPAPSAAEVQSRVPAFEAAAPVFGLPVLYSELGCSVWPVPATGHVGAIRAAGAPPIVVVGTTGDPATPYSDAQALAGQLQRGVLLTRLGDGHTAYPYSKCIRNYVDEYLIQLTPPPAGTSCRTDS
jgi:pimeloyl-ACP methyl ester carboxylesterase